MQIINIVKQQGKAIDKINQENRQQKEQISQLNKELNYTEDQVAALQKKMPSRPANQVSTSSNDNNSENSSAK